jgi:hypothetical protein
MTLIEIYRVRIDPADVDRLLEIREAAVKEFQGQVPELEQAELVRLEDDTWLDVLRWSESVDPERIGKAAEGAPTSAEMHALIADELDHYRGELIRSSHSAWTRAS